jgi:hypothetical protein
MQHTIFAILIAAAGCLSGTVACGAATRVALVCAGGGETGKDVLMLAESLLSQEPAVTLLDRREVQRVLQEQKLTLAGMANSAPALALGKILHVEVFAVLEMSPEEKTPLGLVAFDAQSGVRLQDITLPEKAAEQAAQKVAEAVRAACAKRNRRPDTLQTVCLLAVRNADLPRAMDSRCQALATMLERSLVRSDSLVVLERKRLEHVNKERTLPVANEGGELAVSVLTIDLEIGRGPEGKGLRATAFVNDAAGKRIAKPQVLEADRNIATLSETLVTELLKSLRASAVPPIGDRSAEARRFCREARILRGQINWPAALAAAESAYALNPRDPTNLRQLELALHVYATHTVSGQPSIEISHGLPVTPIDSDQIASAFAMASRSLDIRQERFRLDSRPGGPILQYSLGVSGDDPGLKTMCRESAVPLDHWPAEVRPAVQDFREKYHRQLVARLTQLAADSDQEGVVFTNFLWQWDPSMLADAASDSHEYIADTKTIISRWLDSWKKLGNYPLPSVSRTHVSRPLRFFIWEGSPPRHYNILPEDYAPLRPLFQAMQKHPAPLVQDYGMWGEIWLAERCGGPSSSLEDFKTLIHSHIAEPKLTRLDKKGFRKPSTLSETKEIAAARQSHYLAMLDALKYLNVDDSQRRKERIGLLKFMLDRHEMARQVVGTALSVPAASRQEAEEMAALIDRTKAVLDGGVPDIPGAPGYVIAAIRKQLTDWRQQLESAWPGLGLAAPLIVPWREAHPLVRRTDLGDILRLARPVICDGRLFAAGLRQNSLEAFCIPLEGGSPRSLGEYEGGAGNLVAACAGDGYYCVSGDNGIIVFSPKGARPLQVDQSAGLPSGRVRALAWLDSKLYISLADGGYLVRWDPQDRSCKVLASSRSKESRSPFDDCAPYDISFLTADPQRHRLVFLVRFKVDDPERRSDNGLWQFMLNSGDFGRIMEVDESAIHTCSGSPVHGDELMLWFYTDWLVRVDLKTDLPSVVHGPAIPVPIPRLRSRQASYHNFAGTGPPYAEVDGWLWSGQGMFARMSKETGTVERLPSLDTGKPGACYSYLEPIGDGSRLIVGDESSFWLLTLKDNAQP